MKLSGNGTYAGIFVTDLDGTLLTDDRCFSARDFATLGMLRRHGICVAIATGRSRYSFDQLMANSGLVGGEAPLPVDYVIFSTGAGVMRFPDGEILRSRMLSPDDVGTIVGRLAPFGVDFMIHEPIPGTRHFHYHAPAGGGKDFQARLALYRDFARPFDGATMARIEHVGGATEVLCIVAEDQEQMALEIGAALPGYSVIRATSPLDHRSVWVEIFANAVTKSTAAQWLADSLGLAAEKACAVGNDYNDEDLLSWAGRSFVTGNGPGAMKARYSAISSNNDGGVSEAAALWLAEMGIG